jgi:hypothetical protein
MLDRIVVERHTYRKPPAASSHVNCGQELVRRNDSVEAPQVTQLTRKAPLLHGRHQLPPRITLPGTDSMVQQRHPGATSR